MSNMINDKKLIFLNINKKMQVIQRSLSRFNFGTTVALFCGGPQHEKLAGELIQNLKKASNNSVSFVGKVFLMIRCHW